MFPQKEEKAMVNKFERFYEDVRKIEMGDVENPKVAYAEWVKKIEAEGSVFIDLYRYYVKSKELGHESMNIYGFAIRDVKESIEILKDCGIKKFTISYDSMDMIYDFVEAGAKITGMVKVMTRKKTFGCDAEMKPAVVLEI